MANETKTTAPAGKAIPGTEQFQAMMDEWARLEQKGLEQARQAVEELGRMAQASLAYSAQLSAEWRRLSLEGARRAGEAVGQNPFLPRT